MNPSKPPPPAPLQIEDVSETLQRFLESPSATFEASADAKVRVRVNASMQLLSVEFIDSRLDEGCRRELELATVTAVNAALQKAALAAGDALNELSRRFDAPSRPDDTSAV